jgi:arylsulfatase A-like enzyme
VTSGRNILLVVSDQERQRDWLPGSVRLPWRERLMSEGLEFTNYWTHSSPCSPSRATMMTGRYLPQHGVVDNVINRHHRELDPAIPTVGSLLSAHGYRSSYLGKWHLSYGSSPDMEGYGYSDWQGDDRKFMGWAGTGVYFDPVIAEQAAQWLRTTAQSLDRPWFLTVALVNPHDVMWYPIDQPSYQEEHAEEVAFVRQILEAARWKEDETLPTFDEPYEEIFDELPDNFDDDLHTKPEAHRQWRYDQQHGLWGYVDPGDKGAWLRQLDYYVKLHRLADESLGTVLSALDQSGCASSTAVIFTSDHGDMCGSHGLRSKGPFAYNEIMKVPLYVRVPGLTRPGTVTAALGCHADLASTILALAGAPASPTTRGVDLGQVFADPSASVRDHVLFAQDSAHTRRVQGTRYALRGIFDGRHKYVRYYGVGGGVPSDQLEEQVKTKLFDVDADFDDQDHELYDLQEDPNELENLANDRGRRHAVRRWFEELRSLEEREMSQLDGEA